MCVFFTNIQINIGSHIYTLWPVKPPLPKYPQNVAAIPDPALRCGERGRRAGLRLGLALRRSVRAEPRGERSLRDGERGAFTALHGAVRAAAVRSVLDGLPLYSGTPSLTSL